MVSSFKKYVKIMISGGLLLSDRGTRPLIPPVSAPMGHKKHGLSRPQNRLCYEIENKIHDLITEVGT